MPSRIGRYEIIGEIAMGGMAQLLLARLTGPGGFERPVVVKRILPQYARYPEFREMFLDEGRIAAGISHANVVQHFELGERGDELFLVMEYLEGEPVSSLTRRCVIRATPLPLDLACYIVTLAAAGLHAAHELTDLDGNPRDIVHRDISPHNLFVGYDGAVKVLDFGIAKAADRITQTEAGMLKGKYAYMSPEQALGRPLDRRSDVFALGIVLYELTTRRRLFHRGTPLASLRAVTDDPIVLPSTVIDDYPAALEQICLRALARDRAQRYATAGELRADLLQLCTALQPGGDPESRLKTLMHELFADRMETKKEMLRRFRDGRTLSRVPGALGDGADGEGARGEGEFALPNVAVAEGAPAQRTVPEAAHATTPVPHSPRASMARRIALSVALAALVVPLAMWARDASTAAPTGTSADAPAVAPSAPSATARPGAPALVARPSAPAGVAAQHDSSDTVTIVIDSVPRGSRIELDGSDRGVTPLEARVTRGDQPLSLALHRDGYETLRAEIVPDVRQRVSYTLRRARRRAAGARPAVGAAAVSTTPAESAPAGFPRFN